MRDFLDIILLVFVMCKYGDSDLVRKYIKTDKLECSMVNL